MLNHCQVALHLRRYNKRHDKVLSIIAELVKSFLPPDCQFTTDLSEDSYNFPTHIVPTSLRPDLVLWSDTRKLLYLIELTICFEIGFQEAVRRKASRYSELASEACLSGYRAAVIPVQVESRGVLDEASIDKFRTCLRNIPQRIWKDFKIHLMASVIDESHRIWCDRNEN